MWWDQLPASAAFCDVETTGLGNHDRIVSFGAIGMISRDLAKGRADSEYLYLVFDPGRANRRAAEQIHGFSDSALRLQDPFAVYAAVWLAMQIYLWLHGCPLQRRCRGSLPRTPANLRHAASAPYRVDRQGRRGPDASLLPHTPRHHGRPASRANIASFQRRVM